MNTRDEKLAEARRLLDVAEHRAAQGGEAAALRIVTALRLTLDLIETSEYAAGTSPIRTDASFPVAGTGSEEPALSPAPDSAAMASELDVLWSLEELEAWLRANAHRFAAPAPAVVRDDAWWLETAANGVRKTMQDGMLFVDWLRATFGQDSAPALECRRCLDRLAGSFANMSDPMPQCNGCFATLDPNNYAVADGCPCNSRRGINHGLVARDVCTCDVCDPSQDGCSRVKRLEPHVSPAPAPAFDVRESAEYKALASDSEATQDKARCYGRTLLELGKCIGWDRSIDQQSDGEPLWEAMARALRRRLSAPAFDVEALAKRAQYLHDCNSSVTVRQCVDAAAREMLKGGAK